MRRRTEEMGNNVLSRGTCHWQAPGQEGVRRTLHGLYHVPGDRRWVSGPLPFACAFNIMPPHSYFRSLFNLPGPPSGVGAITYGSSGRRGHPSSRRRAPTVEISTTDNLVAVSDRSLG